MLFQIVKDEKVSYYVNGADVQESNWMRFVNCSRVEDEQNLVAYQYRGEIFYRAYKDIQPGSELLVWYGEQYAAHLGIALDGTTKTEPTSTVNGGKTSYNIHVCSFTSDLLGGSYWDLSWLCLSTPEIVRWKRLLSTALSIYCPDSWLLVLYRIIFML